MLATHIRSSLAPCLALAVALPFASARADVTTQQKTNITIGGMISMSVNSTDQMSGDKQRRESEMRCDGLMSMICGKNKTAEIVRLDKSLEWELKVDKKQYTEKPFPTAADQAAVMQKMKERLQKMKECPNAAVPDKKCELSTPKLDVKTTDEHATIAGHDAKKTVVTLSQTSTCKDSGDVCEINYGFDTWLTADSLPGADEQSAFVRRYLKQMGFEDEAGMMKAEVAQFMGPYADVMKQLQGKAGALKGTALRTTFRLTMGGEKCGQAMRTKSGGAADSASTGGGLLGGIAGGMAGGQVGEIGGKLLGSLFGKKKPAAPPDAAGGAAAAAPNVATMVEFTTETVSFDTGAVAASQFEIPAGFTRNVPKTDAAKDDNFTCPATPGASGSKRGT